MNKLNDRSPQTRAMIQLLVEQMGKILIRSHPELREDEVYYTNEQPVSPGLNVPDLELPPGFTYQRRHPVAFNEKNHVIRGREAVFLNREEYKQYMESRIEALRNPIPPKKL
jgi:hypothetical protein